jgi:hypothetical protein
MEDMNGLWRDACRPIIAEVIERFGTEDIRLLRAELLKVYPFGAKENFPYKVWLDEIKKQIELKNRPFNGWPKRTVDPLPGQKEMF